MAQILEMPSHWMNHKGSIWKLFIRENSFYEFKLHASQPADEAHMKNKGSEMTL